MSHKIKIYETVLTPKKNVKGSRLQDANELHRDVLSGFAGQFPGSTSDHVRLTAGLTWKAIREDSVPGKNGRLVAIIVHSVIEPSYDDDRSQGLFINNGTEEIEIDLTVGNKVRFSLAFAPMRSKAPEDGQSRGRKYLVTDAEEVAKMVIRRLADSGLQVAFEDILMSDKYEYAKSAKFKLGMRTINGTGTITDSEALEVAVGRGVGPKAAWGAAMLILANTSDSE